MSDSKKYMSYKNKYFSVNYILSEREDGVNSKKQ